MKNNVDPDQLASFEASRSGTTLFSRKYIEFSKSYVHMYSAFIGLKRVSKVNTADFNFFCLCLFVCFYG